jgi:hypothetical protein
MQDGMQLIVNTTVTNHDTHLKNRPGGKGFIVEAIDFY